MPNNDKSQPQITNQNRKDFNDYIDYLRTKGVAGSDVLDSNEVGKKYLLDYIKANPNTTLTPDLVAPIQADFLNYRQYALDQIKSGKAVFNKGVDESTFMKDLSINDGWVGSKTSMHKFPNEYMTYIDMVNNTNTTVNKGFATTNK